MYFNWNILTQDFSYFCAKSSIKDEFQTFQTQKRACQTIPTDQNFEKLKDGGDLSSGRMSKLLQTLVKIRWLFGGKFQPILSLINANASAHRGKSFNAEEHHHNSKDKRIFPTIGEFYILQVRGQIFLQYWQDLLTSELC